LLYGVPLHHRPRPVHFAFPGSSPPPLAGPGPVPGVDQAPHLGHPGLIMPVLCAPEPLDGRGRLCQQLVYATAPARFSMTWLSAGWPAAAPSPSPVRAAWLAGVPSRWRELSMVSRKRARFAQLPADESGTYGAARGKWRARARRAGALQLALRRCLRQTRARLGEVLSTPRTPFPWRGLWAARRGGNRPPAVKKRPEAGTNSLVASLAFSDKDLPFTGPDIAQAQAEHFAAAQRWSWPRAPNRSTIGRTDVTWTSGAWRARRKQRRTA